MAARVVISCPVWDGENIISIVKNLKSKCGG